ncbi:MAG: hypothetical protein P4M09_07895 [Devosia sp.]|nr:hypothetical protein [Devosia sp.]
MAYRKPFFHIRKPSLRGMISARASVKRAIRARVCAPRGFGLLTDPKKAIYNRLYRRRTVGVGRLLRKLLKP